MDWVCMDLGVRKNSSAASLDLSQLHAPNTQHRHHGWEKELCSEVTSNDSLSLITRDHSQPRGPSCLSEHSICS